MAVNKILLLISEKHFTFQNKHSAIVNYLNVLVRSLLEKGYQVGTYPAAGPASTKSASPSKWYSPVIRLLKRSFKRIFTSFYNSLLIKELLQHSDQVADQSIHNEKDYALVIEFLTRCSTAGYEIKKKLNIPLLIIYDSPLVEQFEEMYGNSGTALNKVKEAEQLSLANADAIICYSKAVKNYLINDLRITAPVHVIPCIVWKAKVEPAPVKKKYIGFIGSFLKWHKVNVLVSAFERIAPDLPEAELVLIGYGAEWENVKDQVSKSRYKDRIIMTGFVDEAQLEEWKSKLWVGVMPGSNWYGSPLKLFEYAESGIPFIAPSTPSIKELFSESEVLFVEPEKEIDSLARHLITILTNDNVRTDLQTQSSKKMETVFSKENQMAIFTGIVNNLIQKSGTKR